MAVFYRRLPRFRYVAPRTIEEAINFLADHPGEAKPMAGGTDLIPNLKRREIVSPAMVVDLKGIPGLAQVCCGTNLSLQIGALATISSIALHPEIQKFYPSLVQAASVMASPQVRNRGTFGGNLCSAVPSADSAPALLSLEAVVHIRGSGGQRSVPLERFFLGPGKPALEADEIVVRIEIPKPADRSVYLKLSPRHSMDMAVVGVAAAADSVPEGFTNIRIALGAVAPTPMRARQAEEILKEYPVTSALIEKAAQCAAAECKPIDDFRASSAYRRDMVYVLTRLALEQVLNQ